jgi:hypothetical protein
MLMPDNGKEALAGSLGVAVDRLAKSRNSRPLFRCRRRQRSLRCELTPGEHLVRLNAMGDG